MPTLDLRNSTLQELFDQAVAGLRGQGCQVALEGDRCQYRTDKGLKCAFGHLIPDNLYDPVWDKNGYTVSRLISEGIVKIQSDTQRTFLQDLQNAHDDSSDWSSDGLGRVPMKNAPLTMENNLRDVAEQYNLVYTPPEEKKS